jgi:hypothetical protein
MARAIDEENKPIKTKFKFGSQAPWYDQQAIQTLEF